MIRIERVCKIHAGSCRLQFNEAVLLRERRQREDRKWQIDFRQHFHSVRAINNDRCGCIAVDRERSPNSFKFKEGTSLILFWKHRCPALDSAQQNLPSLHPLILLPLRALFHPPQPNLTHHRKQLASPPFLRYCAYAYNPPWPQALVTKGQAAHHQFFVSHLSR